MELWEVEAILKETSALLLEKANEAYAEVIRYKAVTEAKLASANARIAELEKERDVVARERDLLLKLLSRDGNTL